MELARRDLALVAIVPIAMLVIAAIGIFRFHDVGQSSWRGGSFGMFATYEHVDARAAVVLAVDDGKIEVVAVPDDLQDLRDRAVVIPREGATRDLAEAMLERVGADEVTVEIRAHRVRGTDERGVLVAVEVIHRETVG